MGVLLQIFFFLSVSYPQYGHVTGTQFCGGGVFQQWKDGKKPPMYFSHLKLASVFSLKIKGLSAVCPIRGQIFALSFSSRVLETLVFSHISFWLYTSLKISPLAILYAHKKRKV